MKILLIGDIHFKQNSPIPYFNKKLPDGTTLELQRAVKSLKFVEKIIKKEKPDLVIQLGDVFHTLSYTDDIVLLQAFKSFKSLYEVIKSNGGELYVIGGNHCLYSQGNYKSEILPTDRHFSEVEVIEYNGIKLGFVPYSDPEYKMNYTIQTLDADIVFTHTTPKGSYLNKKKITETGLEVPDKKYVFTGHIHIPQIVSENVVCVGSLYQNNFSEQPINLPFGVCILEIEDKIKYKFIENTSVEKLINIYEHNFYEKVEEIEEPPEKYFVRLITNNKDLIEELSEITDKFIVVPEYKKEKEIKKIKGISIQDPDIMIRNYLKKNYPVLERYYAQVKANRN